MWETPCLVSSMHSSAHILYFAGQRMSQVLKCMARQAILLGKPFTCYSPNFNLILEALLRDRPSEAFPHRPPPVATAPKPRRVHPLCQH